MPSEPQSSEEFVDEKTGAFSDFIYGNRINLFLILLGIIFLGSGILIIKNSQNISEIEVVESAKEEEYGQEIIVEIAGAVEKPGVYLFSDYSRIEDLLIKAGGLSAEADRFWVEKYVNRAAKLVDGQKFYIPRIGEQSFGTSANNLSGDSGGFQGTSQGNSQMVNINTADQKELELLPGIGPVYAQSIIEHRPYSTVDDLITKGAIKNYIYDKIKEKVSVY